MLKREITYEDFDGNVIKETFHFHMSKAELVELEASYDGGLEAAILRIVEAKDYKTLIAEFKKIVLMAYGQRSEDGKRFIKSEELRTEFSQTNAYSELFMELATNEVAAAEFINGVVPRDIERAAGVPTTPPPPPFLPPSGQMTPNQ